jgi:ferredoxin-nitrite reductase
MSSSIFYSLRCTEKEFLLLSEVTVAAPKTCPGLFYATPAQDGFLARIRVPGGILSGLQCEAIATLANHFSGGLIQVTNRANLQLRGIQSALPSEALQQLQSLELAAPIPATDAIRNIMSSPTAGIDPQALLDTRSLVMDWNRQLMSRADLGVLSPKLSVCFDGGEAVSVGDRPNDITLIASKIGGSIQFRLHLSQGERGEAPQDVGIGVMPKQAIALLTALAEVYRDYTLEQWEPGQRKPRLRDLLQNWGVERYLQTVAQTLSFPLQFVETQQPKSVPLTYAHLGSHPQKQVGLSYLGVILPLGQLTSEQIRGLAALSSQYGNGILRLTPWQTVIVPHVSTSQAAQVQAQIESLGLRTCVAHPSSAMVACSGITGCASAATDTQTHARVLIAHLERWSTLDTPINIHFSGCEKSCAQHQPRDITLVGVQGVEAYRIYVGSDGSKFGREIDPFSAPAVLPERIEAMIRAYQLHRQGLQESFGTFVNRHMIADLKTLFAPALGQP